MVSKEKELELINTIRDMLRNGDSEEDIVTIFEGFGLDNEYVKELIERAKGKKTIHDFVSIQNQQSTQILQQNDKTQKKDNANVVQRHVENDSVKIESVEEIKDQIQNLNRKIDKLNDDLEKIKEDVEATRRIMEKLMNVYRTVLNKIISKYS